MPAGVLPEEQLIKEIARVNRLSGEYFASFPDYVAYTYILLTVVFCIAKPRVGFMLFVGSTLIRFQDRVAALQSFPVFLVFMASLVLGMAANQNKLEKPNLKQDKMVLLFFGLAAFGLLVMAPAELIRSIYVLFSSLMFYFFATRLIGSVYELQRFVLFLAAVSTAIGAEVALDVYGNPEESIFYSFGASDRIQGLGYFGNPNEFGFLMVMCMPFLFAIVLGKGNVLHKAITLLALAVLGYCMIRTNSRTCMVVSGLTLGMMLVMRGSGNNLKKLVIGGVFGFASLVLLSFLPGPTQERLSTILNYEEDESMQGRIRSWGFGFEMANWRPITGVGLSQWGAHHGLAAHNSFIQVLAETGYVGFFVYTRLIVLCFKEFSVINSPSIDINSKLVVLAVMSSFLGFLVYMALGNQAYSTTFFLYTGLASCVANFSSKLVTQPAEVDLRQGTRRQSAKMRR